MKELNPNTFDTLIKVSICAESSGLKFVNLEKACLFKSLREKAIVSPQTEH